MGTDAIDPQTICNVTIIGDPAQTARIRHRLSRGRTEIRWSADGVEHTIRLAELSSHAPLAELERFIRVAEGVIAVVPAAGGDAARLESILRVADDYQVARLCLVTGLDQPAADFDRCVRTIAGTRGAVPLPLHAPLGSGAGFDGVVDLVGMWALAPMAAEFFGSRWAFAERRYRELVAAVLAQDPSAAAEFRGLREIPAADLSDRIRRLTRIGEAAPILCDPAPSSDDIAPLLDAIVRYLPSPLHVCQPEHTLDY
ncbi:GTP-binding protein [Nocardia sp. NPDC059177]|uniref:GTP-binding protein n=1 Tax=Nocardia sp. NPDC059177 TaxID=3346759 RepID=UPI003689BF99